MKATVHTSRNVDLWVRVNVDGERVKHVTGRLITLGNYGLFVIHRPVAVNPKTGNVVQEPGWRISEARTGVNIRAHYSPYTYKTDLANRALEELERQYTPEEFWTEVSKWEPINDVNQKALREHKLHGKGRTLYIRRIRAEFNHV